MIGHQQLARLSLRSFQRQADQPPIRFLNYEDISAGRVNDLATALASPVGQELNLFVKSSGLGSPDAPPMQRIPVDPDGSGMRRPAPRLGEHTSEVLAGLSRQAKRPAEEPSNGG